MCLQWLSNTTEPHVFDKHHMCLTSKVNSTFKVNSKCLIVTVSCHLLFSAVVDDSPSQEGGVTCAEARVMVCRARLMGSVLWALYLLRVKRAAPKASVLSTWSKRGHTGQVLRSFSGGSGTMCCISLNRNSIFNYYLKRHSQISDHQC